MSSETFTSFEDQSSVKSQLSERSRAKRHEQLLMEENRSLKRRLEKLVPVEINLQKEQVEVTKLKKSAAAQDVHVFQLRRELQKVKGELKKEQEKRALEKKELEMKQMIALKESTEFQNKFIVEKSLRQQKEEQLKKLSNMKMVNEKLNKEKVQLNCRVQDLTGYKSFALKKLEEQSDKLKIMADDRKDLTEQLNTMREKACEYRDLADSLIPTKDKFEALKEQCERQVKDIKKQQRQEDAHKTQIDTFVIETKKLQNKLSQYTDSHKDLEGVVAKMKQNEINLMMDLENQKKEAEKQRHLICKMEDEVNSLRDLKIKLQINERELIKNSLIREEEIQDVRTLIWESERKQRLLSVQSEGLKTERNLAIQNLFKAQAELRQNNATTEKLQEEVGILNLEAVEKNKVLAKTNRAYRSLKKELEKGKMQLAETKNMYEDLKKSQAFLLGTIKLNEVMAEKEKLEKVLLRCNGLVEQQQIRLKLQDAVKVSLEKSIRDSEDEVKLLQLENMRLKDNLETTHLKLQRPILYCRRETILSRHYLQYGDMFIRKIQNKLKKSNGETEELKRRLARRPDDAIQKFQQCQRDNRLLSEQLKGAQGQLLAYQVEYKSVSEENKELTSALKKLKLEFGSKRTPLPPISKTPQPPPEGKSKDKCRPASRRTRFPLTINSEEYLRTTHLRPLLGSPSSRPP